MGLWSETRLVTKGTERTGTESASSSSNILAESLVSNEDSFVSRHTFISENWFSFGAEFEARRLLTFARSNSQMATHDEKTSLVTLVENETQVKTQEVNTRFGRVLVHVQGELDEHKAVFLSVHDIGANHRSVSRSDVTLTVFAARGETSWTTTRVSDQSESS